MESFVVYNRKGDPFNTFRRKMPLILDVLPNSIAYLYESEADAELGENVGGTAFLIHMISSGGIRTAFVVTNTHTINDGFPVVRINRMDGEPPDIIPFTADQWVPHSGKADVSAAVIEDWQKYSAVTINSKFLLSKEEYLSGNKPLFIGHEVYMIGLFEGSPGVAENRPVARGGIISQLPSDKEAELIDYGVKTKQEAFLIEMHSLSGFSGSPVIYNDQSATFSAALTPFLEHMYGVTRLPHMKNATDSWQPIWVIGLDAGGFSNWTEMNAIDEAGKVFRTRYKAKTPSGFSVVIPSWKIRELLMQKEFVDMVTKKEVERATKTFVAERHSSRKTDDEIAPPFSREGFEDALRRASSRPSELEKEKKETSE